MLRTKLVPSYVMICRMPFVVAQQSHHRDISVQGETIEVVKLPTETPSDLQGKPGSDIRRQGYEGQLHKCD